MSASVRRVAAWLALVLAGVAVAIVAFGGGGRPSYVVYAKFHNAAGLLPKYFVKIDEVKAGLVTNIALDRQDDAVVRMQLDKSATPIGAGASAKIRPVNLLGEKYVDLNPGDLSRPLPSGSTIPITRTGAPVELDDVFNTLNPDTRAGLGIIVNEAGLAMAGRGADFNRTLHDLPSALDAARNVVGEVAAQNTSLEHAIVSGNRAIASVSAHSGDLNSLVQNGAGALTAIADARANLGQTVANAPGGLGHLRQTLAQLRTAADELTPAAADLQATAPSLSATLARLPAFANDANGALREAQAVAPVLDRLGVQSTPTLKLMRPTVRHLATFADTLRPVVNMLDAGTGLREFFGFMAGWAGVTSQRDGLGHVFRLRAMIDQELLTSALARYAATLGIKHRGAAKAPAVAKVVQQAAGRLGGALPTGSGGPGGGAAPALSQLQHTVGKTTSAVSGLLAAPSTPAGDGAGGANSKPPAASNTSKLLNYLLGP
jgi:phospholipid/cholesterol/gamma-HCH transport system substrate-binding protein